MFEMGCMRYIPRTWQQFLNKDFASLAEHSFRVAWTAMIIAAHEGADTGKTVKMALLHDLGESRTGDAHYVARLYVQRNEELAIEDIFKGSSLEKEFAALRKEYEERKTLEAKIAKDADVLDIDLELREQAARGYALPPQWAKMRKIAAQQLFTKTARTFWKAIQHANPHDWHAYGRNRFTDGDWKNKENKNN